MIDKNIVDTLRLDKVATHALILLLAMEELGGTATWHKIMHHINQQQYYRYDVSQLYAPLQFELQPQGWVKKHLRQYLLTDAGRVHLRDLCELGYAAPSSLTLLKEATLRQMRLYRHASEVVPFTSGRLRDELPPVKQLEEYVVYAILLKDQVLTDNFGYQVVNHKRDPQLPCLYVGMTSRTAEIRQAEHFHDDVFGNEYVRQYGVCLMPNLYQPLNERHLAREEAAKLEEAFAHELRRLKFAVLAGHLDETQRRLRYERENNR